jgi:hypothetical protein
LCVGVEEVSHVEAETLVVEAIRAIFVDLDVLGVQTIRAEIDRALEPGCLHCAGTSPVKVLESSLAWVTVMNAMHTASSPLALMDT